MVLFSLSLYPYKQSHRDDEKPQEGSARSLAKPTTQHTGVCICKERRKPASYFPKRIEWMNILLVGKGDQGRCSGDDGIWD